MEVSLPIGAIGGNLITNSFVPNSFIQQLNASSASLSEDRSLLSFHFPHLSQIAIPTRNRIRCTLARTEFPAFEGSSLKRQIFAKI